MKKISLVFMVFLFVGCSNAVESWYPIMDRNLYSLGVANSVSGSFFLGCGSIEGELVYYYITDSQEFDGAKKIMSAKSDRVSVVEGTGKSICRIYRSSKCTAKGVGSGVPAGYVRDCPHVRFVFYVPRGSIKYDYNIDVGGGK